MIFVFRFFNFIKIPRGKGKANYKVGLLIEVVEEKLPQGALGWQEVAALYHFRSQETVVRDHEDIKHYWAEKLCNQFKKPTGDPGDLVRDQILCCQRIHARILRKSASVVMGAASDEELSEDAEDEDDEGGEEEEEEEEQEEVIAETQIDPDMTQLDPSLDLRACRDEFARLQQLQGITFSAQAVQQPQPQLQHAVAAAAATTTSTAAATTTSTTTSTAAATATPTATAAVTTTSCPKKTTEEEE